MFRVMAVDDEPVALDFICTLIETRCEGFSVMGTAQNGRECLALMREAQSDVLLTDARMPVMDGIELARQVNASYPGVIIVVVSGFQEFDYVHGALLCGAHDYLLKPLQPSAFTALFARLRAILESRLLARRNRALGKLSKGERLERGEVARCFPDPAYDCVLVRKNGLPKRFAHSGPPEIFEGDEEIGLSIFGRDEMVEYMNDLLFVDAPSGGDQPSRMDTPETFERICGYVRAHLSEPMSVQAVARTFGMSQSYLSKMFRKFGDASFNAFLTEARMDYACTLMEDNPGLYIKDVATMVGYTDPFYFSKSFRAHTGISPKDYLEKLIDKGGTT